MDFDSVFIHFCNDFFSDEFYVILYSDFLRNDQGIFRFGENGIVCRDCNREIRRGIINRYY